MLALVFIYLEEITEEKYKNNANRDPQFYFQSHGWLHTALIF